MRTSLFILAAICLSACKQTGGEYDASGTFESTEIIVSAEASGRIMDLDIQEGQRLNAAQQIGYIDTVQLYLKKMQLLSSKEAVGSKFQDISKQVASIREEIKKQKQERDRTEKLIAANAANEKQLDDINSQIAVLEKQLTAQLSTLQNNNQSISGESSALDVQVAQINDQLQKAKITTPIAGSVLAKYAEAGELTQTGKPLFKIADMDNMTLRAYITSGQLTQLKIGQEVKIFSDYGDKDSRQYTGKVTWISDKSEFTPKTIQTRDERANLVYAVKIGVKNDGLLKIGMYGDVKFN